MPTLLGFASRWWWPFDVLASFRLQYALTLAATSVALLILGRRGAAGAAAVLLLANLVLIVPLWFGKPAAVPDAPTIRVHSHNVHGGGTARDAEVIAALPAARADLAAFSHASRQLADGLERRGGEHRLLYPRTAEDPARMVVTSVQDGVVDARRVSLGPASRSSAVAVDLQLDGRIVHVLAVHTQSPRTPARAALRDRELDHVAAWVRAQDGPVLVIGDLNVTPWSHSFRDLLSATGLRDSQRGFGLQPTWPAGSGLMMVPIDHALHSAELAVVRRTTGPDLGSAHRSLTVEIAWAVDPDL